jgi:signal transduction histidine kinase
VREVLFNVVKHAHTLHAAVTMEKVNRHIQITVSDEGVGFSPDSHDPTNGMGGLTHIQRRVRLMGCDLRVQSQPDKGTQVIIQVPDELASP